MTNYLDRTEKLLGKEQVSSLEDKVIMVVGLGGVGGTALTGLMRSGFKHFIIVDFDKVDETNLNRQILFETKDIGRLKTDVAVERIKAISEDISVEKFNLFVDEESLKVFEGKKIDFIIDAIDKIPSKLALIKFATERNIPFIVSLGMGNRIDPEQVTLTKLNKTENDPLAKKLRHDCRELGLDLKNINVVFSKEEPIVRSKEVYSIITVPSTAGLLITKFIVTFFRSV